VLPSLTTIRCNTVLPTLVVSPSALSLADVKTNIVSCYSAFDTEGSLSSTIVHQVLMLDEIVIEKHVQWDDSVNKFQGICQEHNHKIPLNFMSKKELDLLCNTLEKDNVHLATKVHALSILFLSHAYLCEGNYSCCRNSLI